MAVIETFLKLLVVRKAERLVLLPDEVPILFMADQVILLAMPAVPADLIKRLALEVVGKQGSGELTGDPLEFEHRDAKSLAYQRGVGAHVESFRAGLRDTLQEN